MKRPSENRLLPIALIVVLATVIFAVDVMIPLGVAGGVPYVAVVLVALWLPERRSLAIVAAACTGLTLLGWVLSPFGGEPWQVVFNRALAVFAIWVTAVLSHQIAEQKRTEGSVRESEKRFHMMADAAPMLMWMSGVGRSGTYFNKGWLEFTGRTTEQELGDGWAKGVHPDDLQPLLDNYTTAFNRRDHFMAEYRLRNADGEYRWVYDHGPLVFFPMILSSVISVVASTSPTVS